MIGLQQVACVTALLISFVALTALLNGIVGALAGLIGFEGVTVQLILATCCRHWLSCWVCLGKIQ